MRKMKKMMVDTRMKICLMTSSTWMKRLSTLKRNSLSWILPQISQRMVPPQQLQLHRRLKGVCAVLSETT